MTLKKFSLPILIVAICLIALGQYSSANSNKKEVTFSKDVAPIFYKHCVECHKPNDIAPMSLVSYKDARPWARSIKEKVITREMPPWSPDPHYGDFSNDKRMTQQEIDTIAAWVDQGAKEGNPKELPPAPEFAKGGWQLGKPDVVLTMGEEFTVEPTAPDNYINFFIPTNFDKDVWVQAAEIMPGNKKVVHHVIAFIQTPEQMAKRLAAGEAGKKRTTRSSIMYMDGTLRRVKMDAPVDDNTCDNQPPQGGGQRSNGDEDREGALLAGFAPGMGPNVYAPGTAKLVPKGATIMFQMHYSSFRGALEKPEKDRTSIGLWLAKEPPDKMAFTAGVANVMFKIPAGAENHEVMACMTAPRDIQIMGYMPHMHLRGKDMKYEVIYPDGRRETLLWVPKFNFNWQINYTLKKPITIPKGSKIIVTAHFDNSAKNKYNPDPKKDVRWGDPTYDEMMIGWLEMVIDNPMKMMKPDAARGASSR
ncbi:MAG TPA: cytochrome c [Blastocatellia bacterium]|nr:cytochrome c [Blastocatellia bacterium]